MTRAGDEYKSMAIRKAIKKVGDYGEYVEITPYDFDQERGCTYKIDKKLPVAIIKEISDNIDSEALRLSFKVAQIL